MKDNGAGIMAVLGGAAALIAGVMRPKRQTGGSRAAGVDVTITAPVRGKEGKEAAAKGSCKDETLQVGLPDQPIQKLYEEICQAFAEEKALGFTINADQDPESFARLNAKVEKLLGDYLSAGHQDYRRYCNFCPHHYVRNLVDDNEDFELMILCWRPGQGSRVHNHANSHGWLMPLAGEMVEHQYLPASVDSDRPADTPALPGVINATAPCPNLAHVKTTRVLPGMVAYINDHNGLHSVRCPDDCPSEEGGVTLHLYAPPIRRVKLYEPENDRIVQRIPGFFTVRGKKMTDTRK